MKAYHQLKHRSIAQRHNKWILHHGCPSSFPQVKNLLSWLRDMRETGMAVSVDMTVIRASQIDSVFRHTSSSAKYSTIRCLLQSHGIVIRSKTHEVQTAPAEKREEAKAWVVTVVPILTQPNRHQDWIANMDQTPVPFAMTPKTTLNEQGSRTVNVCSSPGSTMRLTLAMFVTVSGKNLTPYIIFKGKLNRHIMREFSKVNSRYPENAYFTVQDNAWMNEWCCLEWVEKCVKPRVESAPEGIIPLLFLDSYKCHQQASVVNSIAELGVEVQFIPRGCTGLCQAVDVGVNNPSRTECVRCGRSTCWKKDYNSSRHVCQLDRRWHIGVLMHYRIFLKIWLGMLGGMVNTLGFLERMRCNWR